MLASNVGERDFVPPVLIEQVGHCPVTSRISGLSLIRVGYIRVKYIWSWLSSMSTCDCEMKNESVWRPIGGLRRVKSVRIGGVDRKVFTFRNVCAF